MSVSTSSRGDSINEKLDALDDEASVNVEPKVDPLLQRLQSKYSQQRQHQITDLNIRLDRLHAENVEKQNNLIPSIELLSPSTVLMINELESLCTKNGLAQGTELVRAIRIAANNELREAVACIENGYTSAFQSLQRHAAYKMDQATRAAGNSTIAKSEVEPTTEGSTQEKNEEDEKLVKKCPEEWKPSVKSAVIAEYKYQLQHNRQSLPASVARSKFFSLKECCSVFPSMLAESLASLILCEVVRIYLYDEHKNLHCCASYPYHAAQGDPMRATFKEIMLAKDLHSTICGQRLAVNGVEKKPAFQAKRNSEEVKEEIEASGWGSMRSCLIFPIIPLTGSSSSLGMIHCVNKVCASSQEASQFSRDDEVLCSMASRLLGAVLSRYPAENFTLRVGEKLRKRVNPHADTKILDDHIPDRIVDVVGDAAETGNRANATPFPITIFRSKLHNIYGTRKSPANRTYGKLSLVDSTLSSVEFNINSVHELWQTGVEENVVLHQEYRKLEESSKRTTLLLRNLLDGLGAARSMRTIGEITRYLQSLEIFGRSESVELLSDFIAEALIEKAEIRTSIRGSTDKRTPYTLPTIPFGESPEGQREVTADTAAEEKEAFLTREEAEKLLHKNKLLNKTVPSHIHSDGPECIRCYSCDPVKKREQMIFIEEMLKEGEKRRGESARVSAQSNAVTLAEPKKRRSFFQPSNIPPRTERGKEEKVSRPFKIA